MSLHPNNIVKFDREATREFRKALTEARSAGKDSFFFKGHEVLVDYADYVVQYLENKFQMDVPRDS